MFIKLNSMHKIFVGIIAVAAFQLNLSAQYLTPEMLIEMKRVGGIGISDDGKNVIYAVGQVDIASDSKSTKLYVIPIEGGDSREITDYSDFIVNDPVISPNGVYKFDAEEVKIVPIEGKDFYPELTKSNVQIYDELNYRHWDKWEDGKYSHIFVEEIASGNRIDIMEGEPFDCPQQPFGGAEDFIWAAKDATVYYVCKKKYGTEYAVSTNTDIYKYEVATGKTTNMTSGNPGYDTNPTVSSDGEYFAWLQMKRDGYESDKNDIVCRIDDIPVNLTAHWDGTVNSFIFNQANDAIFFTAPVDGTVQLFQIKIPKMGKDYKPKKLYDPVQITKGMFDIRGIVGQSGKTLVVGRGDMNHATELYTVNISDGSMKQLTHENDATYASIKMGEIENRTVKTTDGKDMLTWVIYPPDFDSTHVYPTLLYCQGGPQGALSQFYSYRWNFQLMAAHGYIVVAPNRRGMPGHGVEWNEQISKDYGGQNMKDYLSAIDELAKEPYVDNQRLGCVGASYGGYSAYYLAAIHENRFKTFIAHDGIFNWKSMYGTTEELFFVNWDLGGAYWDKDNAIAQRSHNEFNPAEHVEKWNRPILIIQGGKDFRVPIGQGLEAFQAAKLQGLKSKLLYFPEENHWVLDYQNSLIWQREYYKWLKDTL